MNSNLRFLSICQQDRGIIKGQNIVVIKDTSKDRNFSSGEDAG
ncbi:hypothetical protein [Nostoc piscinale]